MINAAFNIGIYTLIFFLIGMVRPKWALFFLAKPDRFLVTIITTVLVMISVTLYGEGNRRLKLEQAAKEAPQAVIQPPSTVPVPDAQK